MEDRTAGRGPAAGGLGGSDGERGRRGRARDGCRGGRPDGCRGGCRQGSGKAPAGLRRVTNPSATSVDSPFGPVMGSFSHYGGKQRKPVRVRRGPATVTGEHDRR
nr:hypothetical protein KPHV_61880 [Kitasatospora purpeofusca]